MRPSRTVMMGTLRARRWTTCLMAPGEGGREASARHRLAWWTHSPLPSLSHSSSEDELGAKPKVTQQEEGPKGVDEGSESSEESEEEKPPEEEKEEEEEKKAPTPQEKKRRRGGLGVRGPSLCSFPDHLT